MIQWRKSSRSQGAGECVEVSVNARQATLIRDSKDPSGPHLAFRHDDIAGLFARIKDGTLDL
ncbi:hypothetical protein GCM10009678_86070 [Actinomadura kijaniata]|uniref:DUF397 domain-containing protein n=1 Tax=Actinomadura namibiensis TaxID=182080 RepID=A0A7W3QJE9_ACTNM|nr:MULTISPECIES: DUF397 domain-containing protein [Actinomadura]MBA8949409.1 hypothetical protein [Actinomadura namibiensis]